MANENQQRMWNNPGFLESWRKTEPLVSPVTEPLFAALGLAPGESVLDIGCGGGLTTVIAAQAVGPGGRVTGIDISAPLVSLANERAREAGIANVRFQEVDAQAGDFAGAPFDEAVSRLGVMFFDNPPVAFANIRRQMQADGRLVFVCFQTPATNRWWPAEIIAKYSPPAPPREFPVPSPFALGDEAFTQGMLATAGWADVRMTPLVVRAADWGDDDATVTQVRTVAGLGLDSERTEAVLGEVRARMATLAAAEPEAFDRAFWIVEARNPG